MRPLVALALLLPSLALAQGELVFRVGEVLPQRRIVRKGDVMDVKCYSRPFLNIAVGKGKTRAVFKDNPLAKSLCGVILCASATNICKFSPLVFVEEVKK